MYNSVKSAKIEVDAQYGQVESQIQRRADLIPNLVQTVKGYMQYEEKVLTEVTAARTQVAVPHLRRKWRRRMPSSPVPWDGCLPWRRTIPV